MTTKSQNEYLLRKNKALEQRVEILELEAKQFSKFDHHNMIDNIERIEFQNKLKVLYGMQQETNKKYEVLLTVRAEEMKQSK